MTLPVTRSLFFGAAPAALVLVPLTVSAANITWDGNGDAAAGGLWETGVNWSADAVPGAGDNAILGDVASGTREVTIAEGSPQTISRLTITQATEGAFNVLNVNDNLTISLSGANTPFAVNASAGSIVTRIADGKTLLATNSTNGMTGVAFNSILNLGAGSTFRVEALGATSDLAGTSFGGAVNVSGAGAAIILQAGRFVQTPVFHGAVSVANPGSTLTLSSLNGGGAVSGIGGSITFSGDDGSGNAVRLERGTEMIFNNTAGTTYNFTNRVNVAGASGGDTGGKLTFGALIGGSSTRFVNFGGGLVLGEGAAGDVLGPSISVDLAGTSSMAAGASLLIKSDNAQGAWNLTNNGTFTMDGASLVFDWAAAANNTTTNNLGRKFVNTGVWTLKNGASVAFISSTGRSTAGFGFATNNENSGTLGVESGSSVAFSNFYNTGTLNLGSSTAGASDATVHLGSPANLATNVDLINGLTPSGEAGAGVINVNGDAYLGRTTPSSTTRLANGINAAGTFTSTGSTINVGDGSAPAVLTVANTHAVVINAAGNALNINRGGVLLLKSVVTTNSAGSVTLTNNGALTHAGTLQLQGGFNGARSVTVGSAGVYRIHGTGAVIEALPQLNPSDPTNVAVTTFSINEGLLTGATAHDRLTFANSTGRSLASHEVMTISMTGGEIAAGAGTGGDGVSSIGTLEFVNTNITLSGATRLSFDIGGPGNDSAPFDENLDPILTFDRIVLGASRTFALGTGAILDIRLANGFFTETAQTYTLIDTGLGGEGTVSGSFATLLFNGQALSDNEYTVSIGNGMLNVTLAAGLGAPIPEPSAAGVAAALGAIMAALVRRRRR